MAQATTTRGTGFSRRALWLIGLAALVAVLAIAAITYVPPTQLAIGPAKGVAAEFVPNRAQAATIARLNGLADYYGHLDRGQLAEAARWQAQADAFAARAGLPRGQQAYASRLQGLADSLGSN